MINWWAIPFVFSLALVGLCSIVSNDERIPMAPFMAIVILIIGGGVLAVVWLFCFILSLVHP